MQLGIRMKVQKKITHNQGQCRHKLSMHSSHNDTRVSVLSTDKETHPERAGEQWKQKK